jgi:D-inositol-3-phosphate glycosyltransferase
LEALHVRVTEAGVVDAVSLIAPQPHQLLSSWYRAADVAVVPSRAESFGLVALESAACGTPVVASKVGGLATLVTHEENGLLLDSRDASEWAQAVRWCLDDERSTTLSVNAVLSARS